MAVWGKGRGGGGGGGGGKNFFKMFICARMRYNTQALAHRRTWITFQQSFSDELMSQLHVFKT